MKALAPFKEAAEAVIETGGDAFKLCYQCGLCSGVCPWNLVRSFTPRGVMHEVQLGLIELEREEIWLCATCGACVKRCPRGVNLIDVMRAMRRIAVQWRAVPESLRLTLASLGTVGNPFGEAREKRADWARNLGVKAFSRETELLFFPCCTPAYDPKAKAAAIAMVKVLKEAGADFGILGSQESCCGESARKAGDESLFQSLANDNIKAFTKNGVKRVLTLSPHCYHTFRNEYPELGLSGVEVVHYTQYLLELLQSKRLKLSKAVNKKVAYHDPCYLGRHNDIYEEPREVLRSIPGLELVELPDCRENSLCCGGGGGRIWMETKREERFTEIRINQALEVGADILAVACPYCYINLQDSLVTMGKEDVLQIKDISELIAEAI